MVTKTKKFWNWINPVQNEDEPENEPKERILEFYGTIASEPWFDDDITPEMFKQELFAESGPVTIWISSPGGDCTAASRIYAMLMDYKGEVTVKIDGIAASAASVIAMAGTKVLMAPTALMMIHNPVTGAYGDHSDMEKAIELLEEVKKSIINAYELRTGIPPKELAKMMDSETWMNAKKAIELGFADDMLTDSKQPSTDVGAFSFAAREVEQAAFNKIVDTFRMKRVADECLELSKQEEEKVLVKQPEPQGRPVDVLMERLNLIKN